MIPPLFAFTLDTSIYLGGLGLGLDVSVPLIASRFLVLSREAKETDDTFAYKLQAVIYRQKKGSWHNKGSRFLNSFLFFF